MRKNQRANQLSQMSAAAIFFSAFGALWIALSFHLWKMLNWPTACAIALGLTLLLLTALSVRHAANEEPTKAKKPEAARARNWINAILGVAITALYFGLSRLHMEACFPSALTAVVGVHKFALARAFHFAPYYAMGAVLLIWAGISVIVAPMEEMQAVTALGTGLILWLGAAITLVVAVRNLRRSIESLSC